MGEAGNRKKRFFLEAHSLCCFCAGDAASEEPDHQPARVFFRDRKWPDGFEFPACSRCNRATSDAENALSILACDVSTEAGRRHFRERVSWLRIHRPGLLDSLNLSSREKRTAAKALNLPKPDGITYGNLPLVKIDLDVWRPHLDLLGRKLMLAFHYQCFGKPLPRTGGIFLSFFTNTHILSNRFPQDVLDIADNIVMPTHQRKMMHDQFGIRWKAMNEPPSAIFIVMLQRVLVFSGITTVAPDQLKISNDEIAIRPFHWPD